MGSEKEKKASDEMELYLKQMYGQGEGAAKPVDARPTFIGSGDLESAIEDAIYRSVLANVEYSDEEITKEVEKVFHEFQDKLKLFVRAAVSYRDLEKTKQKKS